MTATPSWLDRRIAAMAPTLAVRRLAAKRQFEMMAAQENYSYSGTSFDGARETRYRNHPWFKRLFGWNEDKALGSLDRQKLVLNARDMRRNRGVVAGLLHMFANRVVGNGIVPAPQTSSDAWNREAADFWKQYRNICDYRGRLTGWNMDRVCVFSRGSEGESFYVKMANGKLLPIESQRVQTPQDMAAVEGEKVTQGIRTTKNGRPLGIYICNRQDGGGSVDKSTATYVRWENVIHPVGAVIERIDQLRPNPPLGPVLNRLRDQGKLVEATLFKAELDAMKAWAITSDEDIQAGNMGDRTAEQTETESGIRMEKNDLGEQWYLPANSKMESLASNTPNSQFESFNEGLLREVAMCWQIPYEVLMLDMIGASFSGGHGIWQMANDTWAIWQMWLTHEFLQPWWNWRMAMAIQNKEIAPAPVDKRGLSQWFRVEWSPPNRFSWDPKGTTAADKTRLEMGTTSVTEILRQKGTTIEKVFGETEQEIDFAMKLAERLTKKHPSQPVSWRDIMNSGTPGNQPAAAAPAEPNTSDSEREAEEKENE